MEHIKCEHCGNSYHWHEAFAKFGYDDGDGSVKTPLIAQALENSGYSVEYSRWSPHNSLIYSITKDGREHMPSGDSIYRIGYDDPKEYLSGEIMSLLDEAFPITTIFN